MHIQEGRLMKDNNDNSLNSYLADITVFHSRLITRMKHFTNHTGRVELMLPHCQQPPRRRRRRRRRRSETGSIKQTELILAAFYFVFCFYFPRSLEQHRVVCCCQSFLPRCLQKTTWGEERFKRDGGGSIYNHHSASSIIYLETDP